MLINWVIFSIGSFSQTPKNIKNILTNYKFIVITKL